MDMTLFISANKDISIGNAALYALVGFLIVLSVLALLVGIFYLSGAIFKSKTLNAGHKKKEPVKNAEEPVTVTDDDGEVVAAITAAISVILSEEAVGNEEPEFVIRRVTRKK